MASSANSTLPDIYESYDAIAPAKYAGKLQGKVVREPLFRQLEIYAMADLQFR